MSGRLRMALPPILTLRAKACNVYGNEVPFLSLVVQYQTQDRLHVEMLPRYLGPKNSTWFVLPEELVPKPAFPGISPDISRRTTGDVLFSTKGSKLVYEDQFFELVVPLPEKYNLYGLGEVIHSFRLGNNLTRTMYAADAGTPVDRNIYGTHPHLLGNTFTSPTEIEYTASTHGVFLRNVHGQEVLLREPGITWRSLGGTIDLY
ncbi:galactose mutarotase-like domain-containing protein [Cladorrhinum sp. PSN259]|nr:galactose mutarotase-like domain-containing protein [Cladorrhinum sp. PSN259]